MSQDSNFFGDVFDDPEDDPLLGDESRASDESAASEPDRQGPPSWMSEDPTPNGEASSTDRNENTGPARKQILVDQQKDAGAGLDALNQAVGQGWRLVRISLARPNGEQAATPQAAHRFVAILEQDRPQSLFDFGATT